MSFKLADLEKMTDVQRAEKAQELRAEALKEEAAADAEQEQIQALQASFDARCERAYNLRKLAQTVEQFKKP